MKKTIQHFFPLILTVLCVLFGLHILFHGLADLPNGIFMDIGLPFSSSTQPNHLTLVAKQIESQEKRPLPNPKYIGGTLTVGEANAFDSLFVLQFLDESVASIDTEPTAALYLLDVIYSDGSSILTQLSSAEIESMEELPSAAIYDKEQRLLYFYKGGIYTLRIRLYFDYRPGILFECEIPVEVG